MKKTKKDKFRVSWLKRLMNKIEYYDVQYDYKLIPAITAASCFLAIVLLAVIFLVFE